MMIYKILIISGLAIFPFTVKAALPKDKELADFFKEKTKIENPLELRDPFKAPHFKQTTEGVKAKRGFYVSSKGEYSNIGESQLGNVSVQDMKVVGVLIGKERRALVLPSEGSKQVIVLKEGVKVGPDQAELKAILPGGIVLVEKIVNVYGQEEYLETVIPITR